MIQFSHLRTRRLSVKLRELPLIDCMALAAIPPERHEAAVTELLTRAIQQADKPSDKHLTDPREWSVQERTLVVGHYLAHVSEPNDFIVGDGRFSDYLDTSKDIPDFPIQLGEIGGDEWQFMPLSGAAAEAIESLLGEFQVPDRLHWILGAMAAQMIRTSDGPTPSPLSDFSSYTDWLRSRIQVMASYPESEFIRLMECFLAAQKRAYHFFRIDFANDGLVVRPTKLEGALQATARFPVVICLSTFTVAISGNTAQPSG